MSDEIIKQGEISWDTIVETITGHNPDGKSIWYQKHMAHHNLPGQDLQWVDKMKNILLIRHPREVIISYNKKYKVKNITQLGYTQQTKLYYILTKDNGPAPIIIDAKDVLKDPERLLKILCKKN